MMILRHNITTDRFERINAEPICSGIPNSTFKRKEGEEEIIEREVNPMGTFTMSITAVRAFEENGIKYTQKYKFVAVEEKYKKGFYSDDYVSLTVIHGRLRKPIIYKPVQVDKGIDVIKKLGYAAAKDLVEKWKYRNEEDPEYYSYDENRFPDRDKFIEIIDSDLWDIGFEYMEEKPTYGRIVENLGVKKVEKAYVQGAIQYMDEHFVVKE